MSDDIFCYIIELPDGINEMVTPCADGHTVYIDSRLDDKRRLEAYQHALRHVHNRDFEKPDANLIEVWAHQKNKTCV